MIGGTRFVTIMETNPLLYEDLVLAFLHANLKVISGNL
jgi:hypothetical protein